MLGVDTTLVHKTCMNIQTLAKEVYLADVFQFHVFKILRELHLWEIVSKLVCTMDHII